MARVLLVEDDASLGRTLAERLERDRLIVEWVQTVADASDRIGVGIAGQRRHARSLNRGIRQDDVALKQEAKVDNPHDQQQQERQDDRHLDDFGAVLAVQQTSNAQASHDVTNTPAAIEAAYGIRTAVGESKVSAGSGLSPSARQ